MKGNSARIKRSGGGINSRVNVSVPVRTGAPARGISPGAVSQFGSSVGNHATDHRANLPYKGERYLEGKTPAGGAVPLGNAVAASTVCGVGGSRTVMRNSTQGTHGPTNPGAPNPSAKKPVFPGFK